MGKTRITKEQLDLFKDDYNESDFWDKIKKWKKAAGANIIGKALMLYYTASNNTIDAVKFIIYGALGYFIFPVDLVPDPVPFAGFVDDLVALGTAIAHVASYITPEIKNQARKELEELGFTKDDFIPENQD